MNKQLLFLALFASIGLCTTLDASVCIGCANITAKIGVTTCIGEHSNCGTTVNAIGEVAVIDVSQYKVTSLGKIDKHTEQSIQLPVKPDSLLIYSFTPTEGELANKLIYIVFDNIKPRAGSLQMGKNFVKIYRRTEDQKADQWVEVGQILTDQPIDQLPIALDPSGVLTLYNSITKQLVDIDLGKKDILAPTEPTKS